MGTKFRKWVPLAGALLVGLLVPGLRSAQAAVPDHVYITAFDGTFGDGDAYTIKSSLNGTTGPGTYIAPTDPPTITGSFDTATLTNVQEAVGVFGQVSAHFEYADPTPLANGVAKAVNFNIYEDAAHTLLSDTLNITFTGHIDGNNNMSVDYSFLSDTLDGEVPTPLALAHALTETGDYQDVSAQVAADTGLSGFNGRFTSDIPEIDAGSAASALSCLSIGVLMIRARRRKPTSA